MAKQQFALDYIDVAERIAKFRELHPDGSLQQVSLDFREVGNRWWVIYTAAAYRTPDDERPGIGTAWEPVPGATAFTKDSEVQNAETAAWGRAIVAALAGDTKRSIASAEEVRNRQTSNAAPTETPVALDPLDTAKRDVWEAAVAAGVTTRTENLDRLSAYYAQHVGGDLKTATLEELGQLLALLQAVPA